MSPISKRRRGTSDLVRLNEGSTCRKVSRYGKSLSENQDSSLRDDLDDVIHVKEILVKQIRELSENNLNIKNLLNNVVDKNHCMITDLDMDPTYMDQFKKILDVVTKTGDDVNTIKSDVENLGENISRLDRRVSRNEGRLGINPGKENRVNVNISRYDNDLKKNVDNFVIGSNSARLRLSQTQSGTPLGATSASPHSWVPTETSILIQQGIWNCRPKCVLKKID